jgi:hypothetical protein
LIADSSSRNQRHNEVPPFLGDFYASEVMNIAEGVRRGAHERRLRPSMTAARSINLGELISVSDKR